MDVWPATLPEFGAGTSIQDDESRLTSSMDAGPASVRNRFTAITKSVKTSMVMTGAQIAIFNTFMRTTLKFGSLSFTWVNPVTGASETVRFKKNPEWTCVRPSADVNSRLWSGSMELEILP
jgi:hypothetical protein